MRKTIGALLLALLMIMAPLSFNARGELTSEEKQQIAEYVKRVNKNISELKDDCSSKEITIAKFKDECDDKYSDILKQLDDIEDRLEKLEDAQ